MKSTPARGFTLIEIMIAVAIFAILVMLAAPTYSSFMGNTQIRTAAENALAGVRLAQTSAVKSNRPAKVVINAAGWDVFLFDEDTGTYALTALESYRWATTAPNAVVTPGGGTEVAFDGLGRVCTTVLCSSAGAPAPPVSEIDVTNPSVDPLARRPLKVMVSGIGGTTGATRLCDPAVSAPDPRSCS